MLYIATALPEKNDPTIYGVGSSPENAIADAEAFGADGEFAIYPCSEKLYDRVCRDGGSAIAWKLDHSQHADLA